MAMAESQWIFAGEVAVALLPLLAIAVGVSLVVAIRRDRANRSKD